MTLPTPDRPVRRTVALIAGVAFVVLMVLVEMGATHHLDVAVREYFRPNDEWGPAQARSNPVIDRLGPRRLLALCGLVGLAVALVRQSWRPLAFVGFVIGLTGGLTLAAKFAVFRADPSGELSTLGGSYPSGHTTAVLVLLGLPLLVLAERTRWWQWLVVGAVTFVMGWALMLCAAHWLTDVVGGALLGLSILTLASLVPLRRRRMAPRTTSVAGLNHLPVGQRLTAIAPKRPKVRSAVLYDLRTEPVQLTSSRADYAPGAARNHGSEATMAGAPRVSIGLPVYNGENFLTQSLDALLAQDFTDFELIISDNASTDATADICREYAARDSRIRYFRQEQNIGATPNQDFVFRQSRADLFKLAAHDDLYDKALISRCVEVLDAHPDVVLCHADMAYVDAGGRMIRRYDYTMSTDSPEAPERFRSLLYGDGGDDEYGVVRSSVLRHVRPCGSFHNSGRPFVAEIALHGRFHQVPELMYFRRDHPDRGDRRATIRDLCANLDPRRKGQSTGRLVAEYLVAYVTAVWRAPISIPDRLTCYRQYAGWLAKRLGPHPVRSAVRVLRGVRPPALPDAPEYSSNPAPVSDT